MELFQFVKQAEVEATNNVAERKVRPIAVVRHIRGGSRSPAGSETRSRLHTLYSSWAGRGLDPMTEYLKMLGVQIPLPSS
ncbi:MAG: transposase [Chloroflexota bacterium]|nr:transposase [Chloroflexota bacterium]